MNIQQLQAWILANPAYSFGTALIIFFLIYLITRLLFTRGLVYITTLTKNKYDDIFVKELNPYRTAWLAPFLVLYALSYQAPDYQEIIRKFTLFFIIWISAFTLNALLDALNQIYESSPSFTGVSIQGYLDIIKILILIIAIILSISLFTGESPVILLSGLGALTAVLLFIFQDTILSLLASIQISAQDLVKEGDWLGIPSYDADGVIVDMTLHTIKLQNWDKTISVIPTHKLMQVAFKNWRGMQESGGRRIKRALHIDENSIRFCDDHMLEKFAKIDLIKTEAEKRLADVENFLQQNKSGDSPLNGPQVTNVEIYRHYIEAYLKTHPDIHDQKLTLLVRELAPSPTGLPIEVYVFTRTTEWVAYEQIQAEIFDHLLAAAQYFDLRVFQEPSGSDFRQVITP